MSIDEDESIVLQGPPFHVDLAALDALHPVHYSRRLLIFRCTSSSQRTTQLAALKVGLQALVARCPILGGIIAPLPHDHPNEPTDGQKHHEDWRTILPGPGLELVVRDLRSMMPSFDELERAEFDVSMLPYDLLVPVPGDITNACPFAACKVQFSAIDGGSILTLAMSHSVADGAGSNELIRILSEETRRAQEQHGPTEARMPVAAEDALALTIGFDRSKLRNTTSTIPFRIEDHPAFTLKFNPPPKLHPFEASCAEIPVLLRIPASRLAQLKADASSILDAPPISTHDALTALIWRSVLLIRSRRSGRSAATAANPDALGRIFMPSDARRHFDLPQSYVGNAVYQLAAALPLRTLLSPDGLRHAASAIRRDVRARVELLRRAEPGQLDRLAIHGDRCDDGRRDGHGLDERRLVCS